MTITITHPCALLAGRMITPVVLRRHMTEGVPGSNNTAQNMLATAKDVRIFGFSMNGVTLELSRSEKLHWCLGRNRRMVAS